MSEVDNDFQVRLCPIQNGYLVKRQGIVWYCSNVALALDKIENLVIDWKNEHGAFVGN